MKLRPGSPLSVRPTARRPTHFGDQTVTSRAVSGSIVEEDLAVAAVFRSQKSHMCGKADRKSTGRARR